MRAEAVAKSRAIIPIVRPARAADPSPLNAAHPGALRLLDRARELAGDDPQGMIAVAAAMEKLVPIVAKTDPAAAAALARRRGEVEKYSPGDSTWRWLSQLIRRGD